MGEPTESSVSYDVQLRLQHGYLDTLGYQLLSIVAKSERRFVGHSSAKSYLCLINQRPATSSTREEFAIFLADVNIQNQDSQTSTRAGSCIKSKEDASRIIDHMWPISQLLFINCKPDDGQSDWRFFELGFTDGSSKSFRATSAVDMSQFLATVINLATRHERKQTVRRRKQIDQLLSDRKRSASAKDAKIRKYLGLFDVPPEIWTHGSHALGAGGTSSTTDEHDQSQTGGSSSLDSQSIASSGHFGHEPVTEREAAALSSMMQATRTYDPLLNIERFEADLRSSLTSLDATNAQSLLTSAADPSGKIVEAIDAAVLQLGQLESVLDKYEKIIGQDALTVSSSGPDGEPVVLTDDKLVADNLLALADTLDRSVLKPFSVQDADLVELQSDLGLGVASDDAGLRPKVESADRILKVLVAFVELRLDDRLSLLADMVAVKAQVEKCRSACSAFASNLAAHVVNCFVRCSSIESRTGTVSGKQLRLSRHHSIHGRLLSLESAIGWLHRFSDIYKEFNTDDWRDYSTSLLDSYCTSLAPVYEREIGRFIADAENVTDMSAGSGDYGGSRETRALSTVSMLSTNVPTDSSTQVGLAWLSRDAELCVRFDAVLENILSEVQTVCGEEQSFTGHLFSLDQSKSNELKSAMTKLFGSLETSLSAFVMRYEQHDQMFTIYALLRLQLFLSTRVDNKGSYLGTALGVVVVKIKRRFDTLMNAQLSAVEECRLTTKSSSRLLPVVNSYDIFVNAVEKMIVHRHDKVRQPAVDKWYVVLATAICHTCDRLASAEAGGKDQSPAAVWQMVNFHRLHAVLASTKVDSLDEIRKTVRQRYQTAVDAYVVSQEAKALEKLAIFCSRIRRSIDQDGVRASDIQYQAEFGKQQLQKLVDHYSGRDVVRKALRDQYLRTERHFGDDVEGLLPVVWRHMQSQLIDQYKAMSTLIDVCYPESNIRLDFTVDDLLRYFTDIALSHE